MPKSSKIAYLPYPFIIAHLVVCFALLPRFQYFIEADFTSYATIARKYAAFDFFNAVNAYWSPLISWLMTPFLMVDVSAIYAFRWIVILFGAGVIWQIYKLMENQAVHPILKAGGLAATASYTVYFSLYYSMPDILPVFFLLLYFRLHSTLFLSKQKAVFVGLIGAIAYFSKAYCFPFILLHFFTVLLFLGWTDREKLVQNGKKAAWFLGSFLVFSSFWIVPISLKSNVVTIGSSGAFNYMLKMRNPSSDKLTFPMDYGLIAPPNASATSIWENPPSDLGAWNEQDYFRGNSFFVQAKIFLKNVFGLGKTLNYYNPFFYVLLLFSIIYCLSLLISKKNKAMKDNIFQVSLFACLYPSGYLMVFFTERYLWLLFVLLVVLLVLASNLIYKRLDLHSWQLIFIALGIFAVSAFAPLDRLRNLADRPAKKAEILFEDARIIQTVIPPSAKIAVNRGWMSGNTIAFLNDYQFYGESSPYRSEKHFQSDLQRFDIEYLILSNFEKSSMVEGCPEILGDKIPGTKIFWLKDF